MRFISDQGLFVHHQERTCGFAILSLSPFSITKWRMEGMLVAGRDWCRGAEERRVNDDVCDIS